MFKALKKTQKYKGACHADDVFYLFTTKYHEPPAADSKEFATIKKMVGMFASFAFTSDPNCEEVSHLAIKPCDDLNPLMCININIDDVAQIPLPDFDNLNVWNSIYEAHDVPLY